MLEALEAMVRDNQPLPARALLVNKKGRTLVSSWIEPLQQEPDLGYDVDFVARFGCCYCFQLNCVLLCC